MLLAEPWDDSLRQEAERILKEAENDGLAPRA